MRVLRATLVGTATLALLACLCGPAMAESERRTAFEPPAEFGGFVPCPSYYWRPGLMENYVVGPLEGGNLVRRETRGWKERLDFSRIGDPRLTGILWQSHSMDEFYAPGADALDLPAVGSTTLRLENEGGAWQGTEVSAYYPGGPIRGNEATWHDLVLAGEGGYDGLTAVVIFQRSNDPCGLHTRGVIYPGELPAFPEPAAPPVGS